MPNPVTTIAIDGPVASGKTAVGRRAAELLAFRFLDSGIMYRAVTLAALHAGVSLADTDAVAACAAEAPLAFRYAPAGMRVFLDGADVTGSLRGHDIEAAVSRVSEVAGVRSVLVARQQALAEEGPIVMVGRDIGTVALPQADIKVYLDATVEERARRRHAERITAPGGLTSTLEEVEAALRVRDYVDSHRETSPLRPATDAVMIPTDNLTIEQVVLRVLDLVAERNADA